MRTLLSIDKHGLNGGHFHREQLSKSFLKNMVNFLYMQAAQTNVTMLDSAGGWRTVYLNSNQVSNLAVRPFMMGDNPSRGAMPGEAFGIRLGTSNMAVTPGDYTLLDSMIPHAVTAPEAVSEIKMAYDHLWAYSSYRNTYGSAWTGQTLHLPEAVSATGCRMRFLRAGDLTGRTLTMSLRRIYGDLTNFCTGDLAVGSVALDNSISTDQWGQMLEVSFAAPYVLHPNYQYAVCARTDCINSSNCLRQPYPSSYSGYKSPDHYGMDNQVYSDNAGASWGTDTTYKYSRGYQLLGKTPIGLAHSGTVVFPVTTSGATAQFIMEALFSNYSGSSVTVREVGLFCVGDDNYSNRRALAYMLARDVLEAPIDVLANEILRVRYIPQITV